jgi:hypothetical protein
MKSRSEPRIERAGIGSQARECGLRCSSERIDRLADGRVEVLFADPLSFRHLLIGRLFAGSHPPLARALPRRLRLLGEELKRGLRLRVLFSREVNTEARKEAPRLGSDLERLGCDLQLEDGDRPEYGELVEIDTVGSVGGIERSLCLREQLADRSLAGSNLPWEARPARPVAV